MSEIKYGTPTCACASHHNIPPNGEHGCKSVCERSKSPGKLLMQVHDRLIEESRRKDALAQEMNSIKRYVEEFSIRLDFILKCMFHTPKLCHAVSRFSLTSKLCLTCEGTQ